MAVLDEANRVAVWESHMRDPDLCAETFGTMSKTDLRAAVDALDDYLETNKTAINNALPAAAKAGMTTKQKAKLLMWVVRQRYLTGN